MAKFILSKQKLKEQYDKLENVARVFYSFKTNREVGKQLEKLTDCQFSIHNPEEIDMLEDKSRIWFFSQAWNQEQIEKIVNKGVKNFVVDHKKDVNELLEFIDKNETTINLFLRMKFREHRLGSRKYFVYGMKANKVNELISEIKDNENINKLGVHIHRKSQNASEWEIKEELKDSLTRETLDRISMVNLGGGLPIKYRNYTSDILPYIFKKVRKVRDWLKEENIETIIEPGRFLSGPPVKLETNIIQIYRGNIIIDTSIYQCALDTQITGIKMLVENEKADDQTGEYYLIKGNSPTRDDIFRYRVKLDKEKAKAGGKIVFINAGAYNYTTDFCGFEKLETEVVDEF